MKRYDPIMCMMVDDKTSTKDQKACDVQVKLYSVSYKSNGVYQTIGVHAENETHAKEKARRYFEGRGKEVEIIGASIGESYATMKAKGKPILDEAIHALDASKGHEIVILTENYLRSIGKNNSTGKYDRVIQGVRSLLSQGYLEGEELKKAVQQEANRLLKKYNANDVHTCDASWKAWSLFIDGKFVKSFNSEMPPIKEAQKYMKENYPGKVAKLTRNVGSTSGYTISGREAKDTRICDAPAWGSRYDSIMRSLDNVERHYNEAKKNLLSDLNSIYKDIGEFDSKYGDAASTSYLSKRHAEVMRLVSSMR